MGKNYERIRRRARKISRKTNSMMRSIKEIGSLTNKFTAVIFGDPTLERQIEFHIPESKKIPDLNKLMNDELVKRTTQDATTIRRLVVDCVDGRESNVSGLISPHYSFGKFVEGDICRMLRAERDKASWRKIANDASCLLVEIKTNGQCQRDWDKFFTLRNNQT